MNKSFLLAACAAVCFFANPALAEQPFSDSLTPNLSLGLQFGGGGAQRSDSRLHFTALFDVRSQLLRRDPDRERVDSATFSPGMPLLTVFQFGVDRNGFDAARLLGHDLLGARDHLNAAGESSGSNNWIWWTLGAVAVAAGATVAAAGHSNSSDKAADQRSQNCDVVGGNVTVMPGPSASPSDNPCVKPP